MPIFISMVIWIALMRILFSNTLIYNVLPNRARAYKVTMNVSVLTMSYIVFWMGIHTWMADSTAYIIKYNSINTDLSAIPQVLLSDGKSVLWSASQILIKGLISEDFHVWFIILSSIMGFSVSHFYRKYSELFFYSMLLFIFTREMTYMYNGMRQFLAITLLLPAFPWLIEGKTTKYMILIAILSQIHFTVLIMIPIYFITRCKPWGVITTLSTIGMGIMCTFIAPVAQGMEAALENTHYENYSIISDGGMHPLRAIVTVVPVIIAWLMRKNLAKENNKLLNISINMCLMCALLSIFSVFTSGILMGRLPVYCGMYTAVGIPMILLRIRNKPLRQFTLTSCIVGYAVYFYLNTKDEVYYSDLTGPLSL